MPDSTTGVVVIGGGSTGAGVLRDLTMRGIDAMLVEKGDLASGTTGRSHGLLHVLHNQVGGPSPTGRDISEAEFDGAVALNMKSAFYGYIAGYELLKAAGIERGWP